MPTIRAVVKNDFVKADGKCNIKIRITHQGKVRYLSTPWYCMPSDINRDGTIKPAYPGHTTLNKAIYKQLLQYSSIIESIGPDVRLMDISELAGRLKGTGDDQCGFIEYAKDRIDLLKAQKRFSYAISYEVTLTHLRSHTRRETLSFNEITAKFLSGFEHHLFTKGCSVNTIRIYLNNIRAIFNHAIDNNVIPQEVFPFRKFRIRQEKSRKRSLAPETIRRFMIGPYLPAQQRSMDLFMLIFYLIGINLKDLLYLSPRDWHDGRIWYRRLKTGALFSVKVLPEADSLIRKYKGNRYLLSFLDHDDSYMHYKGFLKETNKRLRIATGLKISTYFARHSWATMASSLGIPKDIISAALGHLLGSAVTDIYIDFDFHLIDEANEKVIRSLFA